MYLNKVIDFLTIIIIVVFTIFLIKVAIYNFDNFQFTADIFRHFSTIRNIFEGVGPYEGPVMQHTFGTHTYFIFYLIAPLLTFFKDPKILILINISSVFLSSILLYFISRRILNRYDKFNIYSLFITLTYLLFPTIFKGYFYQPYGFQADTLATPLFLCLFFSFFLKKISFFIIFSILILSIKEEFILIYPALVIFIFFTSYLFDLKGLKINKKNLILIITNFILCTAIIIPVLLYYSKLNTFDYIPPFWKSNELSFELLYLIIFKFIKIVIPLSPILIFILIISKFEKKIFISISIIFLATILRILENVIIYATPNGSPWGNLILAPIFFIILILVLKRCYEKNLIKNFSLYIATFLVIIISIMNNLIAIPSIKTSIQFYFTHTQNDKFLEEIKFVKDKINKSRDNEYIIIPEYLVHPFVKEINYVSIIYVDQIVSDIQKKKQIILDSSYIVLFKKNQAKLTNNKIIPSKNFITLVRNSKDKIYETENLILYK